MSGFPQGSVTSTCPIAATGMPCALTLYMLGCRSKTRDICVPCRVVSCYVGEQAVRIRMRQRARRDAIAQVAHAGIIRARSRAADGHGRRAAKSQ